MGRGQQHAKNRREGKVKEPHNDNRHRQSVTMKEIRHRRRRRKQREALRHREELN